MSDCYIVRNQHNHYASKQREWVDGSNPRALFRSQHKDEAVNLVFELSSKDITLRAEAITCELDQNNVPVVEVLNPIPDLPAEPDELPEQTLAASVPETEQSDA